MERYYNKDDDDDDDDEEPFFGSEEEEDDDDDDDDDEGITFIDQQGIIDVMQLDIAQTDLTHKLLDKAMTIAKQNWRWYFKSADDKLNEIEAIYKRLVKLTDKSEEEK